MAPPRSNDKRSIIQEPITIPPQQKTGFSVLFPRKASPTKLQSEPGCQVLMQVSGCISFRRGSNGLDGNLPMARAQRHSCQSRSRAGAEGAALCPLGPLKTSCHCHSVGGGVRSSRTGKVMPLPSPCPRAHPCDTLLTLSCSACWESENAKWMLTRACCS